LKKRDRRSSRKVQLDIRRSGPLKLKYVIALPFGIECALGYFNKNADCKEEIQNERE